MYSSKTTTLRNQLNQLMELQGFSLTDQASTENDASVKKVRAALTESIGVDLKNHIGPLTEFETLALNGVEV